MNLRALLIAACCFALALAPALSARAGGDVRVSFADGRVTVIADNATIGEILREWERVGGSRFINADKMPAADRVTLRLENEPETRAIEVLLRSVAGYVVAPRPAGSTSASTVGNVLIMPVSRVASYAQAPPPAHVPVPGSANDLRMAGGPARPDDDGPVRREMPPDVTAEQRQLMQQTLATMQGPVQQGNAAAPAGQASPLGSVQTQTVPGLGIVTSSQPGVVIQNPPRPGGRSTVITPTQPRRGGGGG
ncbi:MAG TPA: hypothetical protein VMN81_01420 [Vicinamibacterales bacterium]|nr:hypothetical protein [Vicinamibacterales bacterium]